MADDFGPNLNPHVSYLDQIGGVRPVDRARGTTPLAPPPGPRIGRDGVRLTERSRRILKALADGNTELDDPDFMRLRQLYQRPGAAEQPPQDMHGFPPELVALVKAYGDEPPALPAAQPGGTGELVAGALRRLRAAYHALIL